MCKLQGKGKSLSRDVSGSFMTTRKSPTISEINSPIKFEELLIYVL